MKEIRRVALVASDDALAKALLERFGFEIVDESPDAVISYGGDGTLMRSEHAYPGVPKLPLRHSNVCKKCSSFPNEEVLKRVKEGKFSVEKLPKLEALANSKRLEGLNDIIIHNADPRHAIRYRVSVDGRPIRHEIIGDGLVIATPFGSTGYYRSITNSSTDVGIGVAFNNSTEPSDHMVLSEESVIEIEITRGPALVFADNVRDEIQLTAGERVTVKKSLETATIIVVE